EGPLALLALRGSVPRHAAWWVTSGAGLVAVVLFLVRLLDRQPGQAAPEATLVTALGLYALKLLLAVHAVYFLQDACRSGAMELLLSTPVSSRRLWGGFQAALRH